MDTRYSLPVVLAVLAASSLGFMGCGVTTDESDQADTSDEALTASMPELVKKGSSDLEARGLPVLFGLDDAPGLKRREFVFAESSTPAHFQDSDGHLVFREVRYEKRIVQVSALGVAVLPTTGGVRNGAALISADNGKVRDAVVASANSEIEQLWNAHPAGRFSIRMFPATHNVARTANGYTVTMSSNGNISAHDAHGSSFDGKADLATVEETHESVGGQDRVSVCKYKVNLKEAAVLKGIANIALFHVERMLVTEGPDAPPCTKPGPSVEDKYVFGQSPN